MRQTAEWEQRSERRARDAQEAGFREGEAAGRKQAQGDLQPVLDRLTQAISQIAALKPRLLQEAESDLLHLSLGIARRILRRELAVNEEAVKGLVKAALDRLQGQEICRVRTHPALESGIREAFSKSGRDSLPIIADHMLEPGAVLLETERGKLDASIETQLDEIGHGLADRLES